MLFEICRKCCLLFICLFSSFHAFSATDKFVIGFPEDDMSNDWRSAQVEQIKLELKKYPDVKFLFADAGGSIAKNIFDIELMVNDGVQLLFLGPRDPESIGLVAAKLRSKGVYIVLLTRKINTEDYDVFISPDDFKIANDAAQFLVKKMSGKGTILMLEGVVSTTTAIQRKKGFMAGIKDNSGLEVISRVANYSRLDAIAVLEELLEQGVKFDAIYAHNDAMAAGARLVLKKAGINPASIPIVSIDYLPETREAILRGEQSASFTYPTCGKVGVEVALDLLRGKKVARNIVVSSQLVTRENANQVEPVY